MIDWKDQKDRPITLSDGTPVTICGGNANYLVGAIHRPDGVISGYVWDLNGKYAGSEMPRLPDLIQAPRRVEYHAWVNLNIRTQHGRLIDLEIGAFETAQRAIASMFYGPKAVATAIPLTITIEGEKHE